MSYDFSWVSHLRTCKVKKNNFSFAACSFVQLVCRTWDKLKHRKSIRTLLYLASSELPELSAQTHRWLYLEIILFHLVASALPWQHSDFQTPSPNPRVFVMRIVCKDVSAEALSGLMKTVFTASFRNRRLVAM